MVSILIVNYFSGKWLKPCIDSVYAFTKGVQFEIIIISNSAEQGLQDRLVNSYPNVRWIQMPENAGFARANNAGILASKGEAILLLNADTQVQSNVIGDCYDFLVRNPDAAAAGTALMFADGSPQIGGSYVKKGGLNYLALIPYLGFILTSAAKKAKVKKPGVEAVGNQGVEVDWINGAFMMVKKSAIEKSGMLDGDFFLYHEESEWCARLKKSGRLYLVGGHSVLHYEGGTTSGVFASQTKAHSDLSDKKGLQILVSLFLRIRKEFGAGWFLFHVVVFTLSIPFVILFSLLDSLVDLPRSQRARGFVHNVFKSWNYIHEIFLQKKKLYKIL